MKVIGKVFFVLFILSASFVTFSQNARAEYGDLDTVLSAEYNQFISNEAPVDGMGNYSPSFSFLIYRDKGSGVDSFDVVGPTESVPICPSFNFYARKVADNMPSGSSAIMNKYSIGGTPPVDGIDYSRGRCTPNPIGFTISGLSEPIPPAQSIWNDSVKFPGKEVLAVQIEIDASKNRGVSNFIDIYANDTRLGTSKLSYLGNPYSVNDATFKGGSGVSFSRFKGDTYGNLVVQFAAPCDYNDGLKRVYWKDADSGNDGRTVNAYLQEYRNSNWRQIASKNAGNGPDVEQFNFTPTKGRKYRIVFDNVRNGDSGIGANTIKVWAPFDSAVPSCPPTSVGASSGCDAIKVTGLAPGKRRAKVSVWHHNDGESYPGYKNASNRLIGGNNDSETSTTSDMYAQSNQDVTYNFTPGKRYIRTEIDYEKFDSSDSKWKSDGNDRHEFICLAASCTISIDKNFNGIGVRAGSQYNVTYRVKNITDQDPDGAGVVEPGNYTLPKDFPGTSTHITLAGVDLNTSIDPGESEEISATEVAANSIGTISKSGYPDYNGSLALGGDCSDTANIYKEYKVNPTASASLNDFENPTSLTWNAGGTWADGYNPGVTVPLLVTVEVRKKDLSNNYSRVSTLINNSSRNFAPWSENPGSPTTVGISRATFSPGERACVNTFVRDGHGWVGPVGTSPVVVGDVETITPDCDRVVNKPYVQFYNGSVYAGGVFENTGATGPGNVNTNYRVSTDVGSGVEYAMLALGTVSNSSTQGFISRMLHSRGLSDKLNFASSPKGQFGASHQIKSYYDTKLDNASVINIPTYSLSSATNGVAYSRSGDLNITGMNNFSGRSSIYVDGDVYITSNIVYSGWNDINTIPNFMLVAKGNIYISKDVTRLDGLYVAEPKDSSNGGVIYTCATGLRAPSSPTTSNCGNQLVVNGSVVAKRVEWLRSFGTLSAGNASEDDANTKAAEIIRYSPDYMLGNPVSSEKENKYTTQTFRQLPPRL